MRERTRQRLEARRTRGKVARIVVIAGLFATSLFANAAVGLGPADALFAAFQIFSLGLDTAPPADVMAAGGLAPSLVWLTRFGAPLVVAESVLFAALVSGVVAKPRFLLEDHVVVVGAGALGRAIVEHLQELAGGSAEIAVVDIDPDAPNLSELRELGAWVVIGDGSLPSVLRDARVERARAVIVVTADDVANVAAMWNAVALCKDTGTRVTVHVEDESLRETIAERSPPFVDVFGVYDEAAKVLVGEAGLGGPGACRVVVAGFGKLGRAVYRHVGVSSEVLVIDRDEPDPLPERRGGPGRLVRGEIDAPKVAREIGACLCEGARGNVEAVVFVCTDQDVRNLDFALGLRRRIQSERLSVRTVTRMMHAPPIGSSLLEEVGARSIAEIVAGSPRFRQLPPERPARGGDILRRLLSRLAQGTGAT